jgi:hypothetical protein
MRDGTHSTEFWGPEIRARIASQLEYIRHWIAIEGQYSDCPDLDATWFVDPPYRRAGKYYVRPSGSIDFAHLAQWCKSRKGQVIVCENEGADWLPFVPFRAIKATSGARRSGLSKEVIWTNP